MKAIIRLFKRTRKPAPSARSQPRQLTGWQRSIIELQAIFIVPQNRGPVPTFADSLNWLKAVV